MSPRPCRSGLRPHPMATMLAERVDLSSPRPLTVLTTLPKVSECIQAPADDFETYETNSGLRGLLLFLCHVFPL
jgi:hypothetical protein